MAVTGLEIATAELLRRLYMISTKSWRYKNTAEQLITLIESIRPTIKEIQYSSGELTDHRKAQFGMLFEKLEEGKELSDEILSSRQWNLYQQLTLARKMEKLEKTISSILEAEICTHILAEVHSLPADSDVRLSNSSSSYSDMEVETEEMGDCSINPIEGDSSRIVSGGPIITSWQKGQLLGRGSFGSVYEGISGDGEFFAVKEVSLLDQGSQAQECIQQLEGEIVLLSQLQHQNIVRYRGTSKDGSNLYIFLELVSQGSLKKLYERYQLRNSVVSMYTRQILDGLKYIHDKSVIHRDINCANILVETNGAIKLADFGLAKVSKFSDIKSCKGNPFWMAPEVINPKGNDGYGSPVDIWGLGCTVLEMLTGQKPYWSLEPVQALFKIGRGELPDIPDTLSLDARHFILKCLKVNPEERPTAAELLNHPFVRRPLPSMGSGGLVLASPLLHRQGQF